MRGIEGSTSELCDVEGLPGLVEHEDAVAVVKVVRAFVVEALSDGTCREGVPINSEHAGRYFLERGGAGLLMIEKARIDVTV